MAAGSDKLNTKRHTGRDGVLDVRHTRQRERWQNGRLVAVATFQHGGDNAWPRFGAMPDLPLNHLPKHCKYVQSTENDCLQVIDAAAVAEAVFKLLKISVA